MEKDKTEDLGEIEVVELEEVQGDKEDLVAKEEQIKEQEENQIEEQEEELDQELGTILREDIAKSARNVDTTHYFTAQSSQNMFPEGTM